MDEKELINDLLVELECPVCTDYMQPPIKQCKRGHSLCNKCFAKVNRCPTCKGELTCDGRSYALEKLAKKLARFPCRNSERGCVFRAYDAVALSQHKIECHYNELQCLLAKEEECDWCGIAEEMRDHCLEAHREQTKTTSQLGFFIVDFAARIPKIKFHSYVIYVYEQVFKLVINYNSATEFFGWCVFHLSTNENTSKSIKNYEFKITIFEEEGLFGQKISLCGLCPLVPLGEIPKELDKYLMGNNFAFFKNFCKYSDMHYTVSIMKPDDED